MDRPLFEIVRDELDLYGSLWPGKLARIFEVIADQVEHRGAIQYDLDPGETADWLRMEADYARCEGVELPDNLG